MKETTPQNARKEVLIKYKSTFFAFHQFFEQWNEPFENKADPRRLKGTTKAVAEACLLIFGEQLAKSGKVMVAAGTCEQEISWIEDLKTNNVAIAKRANCSERTVRTHITKLLEAGLFVNKKNHGPVKNFDLRFNRKLIRVKQFVDLEVLQKEINEILMVAREETQLQWLAEQQRQISPPIDSYRNKNNKDNTLVTTQKGLLQVEEVLSGNSSRNSSRNSSGNSSGNRRGCNQKEKNKEVAAAKKAVLFEKLIKKLALDLWLLAYRLIYTDQEFSEDAKLEFRTMLIPYFKNCRTTEHAHRTFEEYETRIAMAARYYSKNPSFNKLHPFKYFNPAYTTGFIGTKPWYKNYRRARALKVRINHVNKQVEWLKKEPTLNNFHLAKAKVASFGNPRLEAQFYAQLTTMNFTKNQEE